MKNLIGKITKINNNKSDGKLRVFYVVFLEENRFPIILFLKLFFCFSNVFKYKFVWTE